AELLIARRADVNRRDKRGLTPLHRAAGGARESIAGHVVTSEPGVDPTTLDGARVVVVGNKKAGDVRRILGDRYYEFSYIRLWWPMQEYFNLNYSCCFDNWCCNNFTIGTCKMGWSYYLSACRWGGILVCN
ncbi:MAG: ankyrin repeat domain-containing protein, partial [Planctomycetes bacterium]|nr:ankyrin repeat domain-containing protein [Planctomycetota bacterium]